MHTKQQLFDYLSDLAITTTCFTHEPVFTCQEAREVIKRDKIPGAETKNLFLKDNNKHYYLLVALAETKIDLKTLSLALNAPKLRFAQPDQLNHYLSVDPGSVTPFAILNDTSHSVHVILDKGLFNYGLLGFHPLLNDATITISPSDLERFIISCKNSVQTHHFGP